MSNEKINGISNKPVNIKFFDWKNPQKFETPFKMFNYRAETKKEEEKAPTPAENLFSKWNNVIQEAIKINPKTKPITQEFFDELFNMAKRLNCSAEDLAAIMYNESRFDPQAKNETGKYAGLIQMDKTTFNEIFKNSKTTYAQYCKLSAVKQLKFAEGYIAYRIKERKLSGKKLSGAQVYALIHRPADVNKQSELNNRNKVLKAVNNTLRQHNKIDKKG